MPGMLFVGECSSEYLVIVCILINFKCFECCFALLKSHNFVEIRTLSYEGCCVLVTRCSGQLPRCGHFATGRAPDA